MYKKRKRRQRTQIGRGKIKKFLKKFVKNVGLPVLYKKTKGRKFKVPLLPYHFKIKKEGNSYGLQGGMTFHPLPFYSKTFTKKVL